MIRGWSFWVLSISLAAVGAFSQWCFFSPVKPESPARVASIPLQLGDWVGQDVPLDKRTYQMLETQDILYRRYRSDSERSPVDLSIVLSRGNRKAFHPPEVCYVGSGYHLDRRPHEFLEIPSMAGGSRVPFNSLRVGYGQDQELVLFCYAAGSDLTPSYYLQQLKIIWAQLSGRPAMAALIRFSTPVGQETEGQAMVRLRQFVQTHLPIVLKTITDPGSLS